MNTNCMPAEQNTKGPHSVNACPCILFVEDDPNDALLLQRALKRVCEQAPVHRVSHGGEAIAYLQGEGRYADRVAHPLPALLIMDLKMPVMGGIEVLSWLKEHPALASIPTVVLSGSSRKDDMEQAKKLNAASYIVKPFDLEEWRAIARELAERWLGIGRVQPVSEQFAG
jgi:CheY-like chemotaxis protein